MWSQHEKNHVVITYKIYCDNTDSKFSKFMQVVVPTIFWLPFLYYNDDSPFRSQGFDYLVTVVMWWGTVQVELFGSLHKGEEFGKMPGFKQKLYDLVELIITGIWGMILLVMSVDYISDAEKGFEFGYTIFMICYLGFFICCMPLFLCVSLCSLCFSTKDIEQAATKHAERQYMEKNGLTTALEMEQIA